MADFEIEVAGKLTALEFVLEVMLANELASQDPEHTQKFKTDLLSKRGYLRKGPVDADRLKAIEASSTANLENFLAKVSEREADIRKRIARGL